MRQERKCKIQCKTTKKRLGAIKDTQPSGGLYHNFLLKR